MTCAVEGLQSSDCDIFVRDLLRRGAVMAMRGDAMYNNKRVLVTGGASFIGSHLVESLLKLNAKITVIDDFSSGARANLDGVRNDVEIVEGDLRDYRAAFDVSSGQHFVFHLANIHGGRGFIDNNPADICQNFVIDGNVLRAAHLSGVNRFCYVSSACVYPTSLQTGDRSKQVRYLSEEMADPFKDGRALADGQYGWGKLMGEMALQSYYKQFGLNGVACRLFTVYGPRENMTHAIIALIAKALIRQDPFEIWGTGQQDRNFTYVSDVVDGLLIAAERVSDCRAVNIGTDQIVKIADAASIICEIIGHKPSKIFFDTSKPEGVHARSASIALQERLLGWTPRVSFRDGVEATIGWFSEFHDPDLLGHEFDRRLFERIVTL